MSTSPGHGDLVDDPTRHRKTFVDTTSQDDSAPTRAQGDASDTLTAGVHDHAPWRPMCNERRLSNGQLRGACLNDDGTSRIQPLPGPSAQDRLREARLEGVAIAARHVLLDEADVRRIETVLVEHLDEAQVTDAQTLARQIAADLRPNLEAVLRRRLSAARGEADRD